MTEGRNTPMNADDVVTCERAKTLPNLLRMIASTSVSSRQIEQAADLIESLTADAASYQQVKKCLADEGFSDLPTMIARYKQVMHDANEIYMAKDEDIDDLRKQLTASHRRERALIADLRICCETCAHKDDPRKCPGGKCSFQGYEYWQWRGDAEGEKV